MKKRVLLIGKRKSILRKLTRQLMAEGFDCTWIAGIARAEKELLESHYDAVAFGRGIYRYDREQLKEKYLAHHSDTVFLEGLAPIVPLLVAQIRLALNPPSGQRPDFVAGSFERTAEGLNVHFSVTKPSWLEVELYRLTLFYRIKRDILTLGDVSQGQHEVTIPSTVFGTKLPHFMVVKNKTRVLAVQPVSLPAAEHVSWAPPV